jgi:methyl-accepting chemotaxis protein
MLVNRFIGDVSLRNKLLVIGVGLPAIIFGLLLFLYSGEAQDKAVLSSVDKARAICLAVESAREQTEKQWDYGIFSPSFLKEWSEKGESEKVFSTIPVVTAWESAMSKCEEGGYQFHVPALEPRNPENLPNELQREALKQIKNQNLEEYHVLNEETNSVHYFRPVLLSDSCLACHGDPATSMALWGNDQGIDATGYKMENWKAGQMHGAFEVVQCVEKAQQEANRSVLFAIAFAIVALGISGVVTVFMTRGITNKISSSINVISTCVGNLKSFAENFVRQSGENSEQTSAMQSSVEVVNENITTVSSAIDEMGEAINEIAQRSSEASQVAESAVGETSSTREAMQRLEQSCRRIDDVVNLINGLTEQTNLLALNATIEAARAGEAGKGFAVVANEVKELANQTGRATGGISEVISSIHNDTADAIGSVNRIHDTITEINSAQQAIAAAVSEQSATTQSIIGNLSEVSSLSGEMEGRIRSVSGSTSETSSQAMQSTELVSEIEATARQFPRMVGV